MLEDYEPVAVRLDRWIQAELAAGHIPRVYTTMLSQPGADICVFRAELWRILVLNNGSGERTMLLATGHAEEVRGSNNITRSSHVEVCETSALGRALANWNLAGSDPNKRASREEMQKVQRYSNAGEIASATEPQLEAIKNMSRKLGKTPPVNLDELTKRQASDIIDQLKKELNG